MNKKGAIYELMAKSQFSLNSNGYFNGYTQNNANFIAGQESEELHLFARILAEKLKVIKPVLLTVAVKNLDQAGIYIMQNTMVRGGRGNGQPGKKI